MSTLDTKFETKIPLEKLELLIADFSPEKQTTIFELVFWQEYRALAISQSSLESLEDLVAVCKVFAALDITQHFIELVRSIERFAVSGSKDALVLAISDFTEYCKNKDLTYTLQCVEAYLTVS
jgi:hypothetical protein